VRKFPRNALPGRDRHTHAGSECRLKHIRPRQIAAVDGERVDRRKAEGATTISIEERAIDPTRATSAEVRPSPIGA
jgi:hypothetical protein